MPAGQEKVEGSEKQQIALINKYVPQSDTNVPITLPSVKMKLCGNLPGKNLLKISRKQGGIKCPQGSSLPKLNFQLEIKLDNISEETASIQRILLIVHIKSYVLWKFEAFWWNIGKVIENMRANLVGNYLFRALKNQGGSSLPRDQVYPVSPTGLIPKS